MTVGEWLAQRTPAPPSPLDVRVRAALHRQIGGRASEAYGAVLSTAESLLAELLILGCESRERALDLLAIDALITYAFEAAAESPDTLSARATHAMGTIAALASPIART